MNFAIRIVALCAAIVSVTACGGGNGSSATPTPSPTPTPIDQANYTKSFKTYMEAAGINFQGFSNDPALYSAAECTVEHPGKDNATAECRVATFDNDKNDATAVPKDALYEYNRQKAVLTKALPAGAKGAEQKGALPNTPLRYAATSGKNGVILILTQSGTQWIVGYVFQKVSG